jgi:hypothetical protein
MQHGLPAAVAAAAAEVCSSEGVFQVVHHVWQRWYEQLMHHGQRLSCLGIMQVCNYSRLVRGPGATAALIHEVAGGDSRHDELWNP